MLAVECDECSGAGDRRRHAVQCDACLFALGASDRRSDWSHVCHKSDRRKIKSFRAWAEWKFNQSCQLLLPLDHNRTLLEWQEYIASSMFSFSKVVQQITHFTPVSLVP